MKFSIEDLSSKYDQISRKPRIWSYLQKKSLTEKFIFCAIYTFLRKTSQNFYVYTEAATRGYL